MAKCRALTGLAVKGLTLLFEKWLFLGRHLGHYWASNTLRAKLQVPNMQIVSLR